MTSTPLDELLERIDNTPIGAEERALLTDALRLADEEGDEVGGYRVRLRVTNSAHMSGDTETLLSSFAWCVARYAADPERFPAQLDGHDLLFQYKWMAGRIGANPAFALAQVEALADDMARTYREAGVSQSGVLQSRVSTSVLAGDLDGAVRAQSERDRIPRDAYSHCEACVRSTDARLAMLRGDEAESLRLFDEIIAEGLNCGEEPEAAEGEALLPLLRAGRIDEAVEHHRRGYRAARLLPEGFPLIADHLVFCAVTGNSARGLAILERHIIDMAADPLNVASVFFQLISVATLLDEVVRAGEGDTLVRGSDSPQLTELLGASDGPRTAEAFAQQAWQSADQLAARFDARNANDFYARLVVRQRALLEERYEVPLDAPTFAPVAEQSAEPVDAAGWLARTRDLFTGEFHGAALAVIRGLELAEPGPLRTELLRFAAFIAAAHDAPDAIERTAAYVAALRADGRPLRAGVEHDIATRAFDADAIPAIRALADELPVDGAEPDARARVLAVLGDQYLRDGQAEQAVAPLREAVELFTAAGLDYPAHELAVPQLRLAVALANSGDEATADALVDAVAADPYTLAVVRLQALDLQARRARANDDIAAAVQIAERALTAWIATGEREGIVAAAELAAELLSANDRDVDAAARIRFAIREATLAELPTAWLRVALARYELWSNRAADALETLEQLSDELSDETPDDFLAMLRYWQGEAAIAEGEPGLAYSAWSAAVAHAGKAPETASLESRAALRLGELLQGYGDSDAIGAFRTALDAARRDGDLGATVRAQHGLGRVLAMAGDESGLTELDAVHAVALEQGADWLAADVTDSRGRALADLGRFDDAIPVLEAAAAAFAALGDADSVVGSHLTAAHTLRRADRASDAVEHYRRALAAATERPLAIEEEFAELLDGLGQSDAAAAVRAGAV
jgi:hypothetical protein